jgi:phage tail tube protein FII
LNLGFENLEVSFWVEGFSSGALDEFGGGIAAAV